MFRASIARSATTVLARRSYILASRKTRPAFQYRCESNYTPPKQRTPEEQAKKEAKDRMNELQSDWDAKEITYAELKPRTESPVPVSVSLLSSVGSYRMLKQDTYLIDVREPDEVIQGMIPSAINLPLSILGNSLHLDRAAFFERHGFEKPRKDQQLIFYCRSGKRSSSASDVAKRNGFTKFSILNYKGSWLEWVEKKNIEKYRLSPAHVPPIFTLSLLVPSDHRIPLVNPGYDLAVPEDRIIVFFDVGSLRHHLPPRTLASMTIANMYIDLLTPGHKPWLVRTLEPICDAEPGALADYILALLKHNVPEGEMRQELAVQLDEFLEKAACASFIDTLFTVLRTKSYLPYSAASPSSPSFASKNLDNGIPIPLDGLLSPSLSQSAERSLKRNVENDERDERAPAKAPRLSNEGQFSRYSNGQGGRGENRSTGGWGGRGDQRQSSNGYRDGVDMLGAGMGADMVMGGMMMPGMNSPMGQMNGRRSQVYQPPDQKRGICRDYHNNGYCARGATCKYSHGEDAVVPGMFPMNAAMPLPFMPMFPGAGNPFGMGGGMGTTYDPHEARMDMRPMGNRNQRAPLLPRIQQEDGSQVVHTTATGELPVIQDLTPLSPNSEKTTLAGQSHTESQNPALHSLPQHQSTLTQPDYNPSSYDSIQDGGINGQPYMSTNLPRDVGMDMRPPTNHQPTNSRPSRGGGRGRGGGGTFGGENPNFRSERRNDKTLVVEKIPEDKLTLEHVNEWFKRFGTVTNVAIDSVNAKALISFSHHDEAYAAWKSEDAVFNNRFVKLFWHRPMEGHGSLGTRMLAASAPLVANIASSKETTRPVATSSKPHLSQKSSVSASTSASILAAKQQLLEQQIAEQKSLMASLDKASSEEKKTIMARLRKLGEEMHTSTMTEAPIPKVTNGATDLEKRERDRLDKELDMHSATGGGEESTEDLKAKLEKLKAEAASLGISESSTEPYYNGGYRPHRGRGRGSRGYRTSIRGGHLPRASMKLDNRSKKLLVKGVREEGVQNLRDWYETTGQVESLERLDSGDIIVTFRSRAAAEQGLAKGSNIPTVGAVQITWYAGQLHMSTTIPKAPPNVPSGPPDTVMTEPSLSRSPKILHSPRPQDEEVIASGWGEDGDGEDGMGML
ncbi:hypothetical protein C0995_011307 [Termitomyces sp. Mi166|nr:hypothetical protein C0995_011307 [Termitomyces sp. Mi166\